jgi:carboxypeptidase D
MQLLSFLALGGFATSVTARSFQSVGKRVEPARPRLERPQQMAHPVKRQATSIITTEASKSMQQHSDMRSIAK